MSGWKGGAVPGQIMADLEDGIWMGSKKMAPKPALRADYITAMVKGKGGKHYTVKGANAQSGSLHVIYDGKRPTVDHPSPIHSYNPMKLQGAIGLVCPKASAFICLFGVG